MEKSGNHILIVDDNVNNLQVTGKLLKEYGYLLSFAQDGKTALTQLEKFTPDLILLDIMMPEMDGLEVCRRIKAVDKFFDIPVIFLTAKNQTEDLVEGFKVGGVDYISKPFNSDELLVRVKNHLELANARKKIVEMNRTRDIIYSIIAHDIKSPLATISMMLSVIGTGKMSPESQSFKDIIAGLMSSTKNTLNLLQNLLNWTKVQSEVIAVVPNIGSVKAVMKDCIDLLAMNATDKKITLDYSLLEDYEAYFDEVTMLTIFRNLLSNAIKFTPENGVIRFSSQLFDDSVVVKLCDSGVGMSPEIVQKVFYDNLHYTSRGTNNEHGNGLGLYMTKDFIAKNNCKLLVDSTPDVGTCMSVAIPRTKKDVLK